MGISDWSSDVCSSYLMASTVPTHRRNAVAGLYPLRRERVRHALRVRADVGIGRSGDASLGIARYDLAPAMPVRRMVDDPIDRQRHILHQTVHAARPSHILALITSLLHNSQHPPVGNACVHT